MEDRLTPELFERSFEAVRKLAYNLPRQDTMLVSWKGKLWEMPLKQACELILKGKASIVSF